MIYIFGGTTEGREIVEFFEQTKTCAKYFVATEYGEEMIGETKFVQAMRGRKGKGEILSLLSCENVEMVVDATHPFATEVSNHLKECCKSTNTRYIRIIRQKIPKVESSVRGETEQALSNNDSNNDSNNGSNNAPSNAASWDEESVLYFQTLDAIVDYLKQTTGNVLLTTGSKQILDFVKLGTDRLYARVLPDEESIKACVNAQIAKSHILAMQGPFSAGLNKMLLENYHCSYLVTKESGSVGGFYEKISGAKLANAMVLVLARPDEETGMSVEKFKQKWSDRCKREQSRENILPPSAQQISEKMKGMVNAQSNKGMVNLPHNASVSKEINIDESHLRVSVLGIGPGSVSYLTAAAREKIIQADAICGAARMIAFAKEINPDFSENTEYLPEKIVRWILERAESGNKNIVVLMSGDSGFYSGTKRLCRCMEEAGINPPCIYPGISSVSLMASLVGIPWDSYHILSLHGKEKVSHGIFFYPELIMSVFEHEYSFAITDGSEKNAGILRELVDSGLGDVTVYIGEELGYENQKITKDMAKNLLSHEFSKLCVLLIRNPDFQANRHGIGIRDDEFVRGNVPMTKEEVRTLSVSKLKIQKEDICFDIGAGTGSVSVEMSRQARAVYAIEMKEEAIDLIRENASKFDISHTLMKDALSKYRLNIIHAKALEVLEHLPAPDCVFIGGSSGELKGILEKCFSMNKLARVVMNAVSLETMAELCDIVKQYESLGYEAEITTVNVSKSRRIGGYHMMNAQNPVMIVSLQWKC